MILDASEAKQLTAAGKLRRLYREQECAAKEVKRVLRKIEKAAERGCDAIVWGEGPFGKYMSSSTRRVLEDMGFTVGESFTYDCSTYQVVEWREES